MPGIISIPFYCISSRWTIPAFHHVLRWPSLPSGWGYGTGLKWGGRCLKIWNNQSTREENKIWKASWGWVIKKMLISVWSVSESWEHRLKEKGFHSPRGTSSEFWCLQECNLWLSRWAFPKGFWVAKALPGDWGGFFCSWFMRLTLQIVWWDVAILTYR